MDIADVKKPALSGPLGEAIELFLLLLSYVDLTIKSQSSVLHGNSNGTPRANAYSCLSGGFA